VPHTPSGQDTEWTYSTAPDPQGGRALKRDV